MTPQVTAQDAVCDKITLTSVSQTMVDAGQVATSDNALTAFRGGHLKVAGGVSHMGERTLGLCLSSLAAMTDPLADVVLASGLTPMCASFNACLDFACDTNADILFHTASDVVVDPRALTALLEVMDLSQNYLAVARGHDPMFGDDTSVGIWIWNMRIMKRDFRFNDVFKQDLDLCERVEAATGKTRVYTPYGMRLGRHHPIWTPEELYAKFVYSYPKHNARRKKHMRDFLDRGLAANPLNKALIAGRVGLAWEDGDLMLHTPSRPERKGTDFFQAAGNRLTAERGLRCEVVTGVTHQYITEKKRSATIFFDQAGRERPEDGGKLIGWYGNSALEAAVYGVPTIAHLSNEALERAARLGLKTAALNTEPSEEGLYRVMSDFFDRSPTERLALARQTRDWIEAEHSYHATAAKLSAMYEGL